MNLRRLRSRTATAVALAIILVVVGVSRFLLARAGVAFDATLLENGFQFLDRVLLRDDARRSLWHLHGQPPLYNALLAVVLDHFPGREGWALCWFHRGLTVLTGWVTYLLARELRAPAWLALGAAILEVLGPGTICYENWLFYSHAEALLVPSVALFLARYVRTGTRPDGFAAFCLAATLALVRSLFHPLWMALLVVLAVAARPRHWRQTLLLALVPLAAVFGWCLKNQVQVGVFGTSSWSGMSISKMVTRTMRPEERADLLARGVLPPIFAVDEFEPVEKYFPYLPPAPVTGITALDQTTKSTGGANMNHILYPIACRAFGAGAVRLALTEPRRYLEGVRDAVLLYLKPSSEYFLVVGNVPHFWRYERYYNMVVFGRFGEHAYIKDGGRLVWGDRLVRLKSTGLWIAPWLAAMMVTGGVALVRCLQGLARRRAAAWGVVTMGFLVGWVTLVGTTLDVGENNRFRYPLEPLMFAWLAAAVSRRPWEGGRPRPHP